ncbi:toll/interleukin-1 receptor domain-containing protein [Agromyces binzhouensis]|uniref:Toll/interleukin-1 receptor domain-containing protein n=1 Tax=Agromyces binzhouensis TaxID=1817495 RepID=A0A4Q2JWM3_9MICO|nr:toll/interleukin-1 receptor domain-containing protein [Agromyces binzhouensis]RXZ51814.1 toll/interleukin-1 receptor domain-containing protein [Agromyces binzhouensis]
MSGDHVFISYITEDSEQIDELQDALEAAEFIVWRDKDKLWPGDDWQTEIRNAIRSGSFVFLACFSSNLAKREKSYQFEELTLAAEEYRQRPPGAAWLMTARLDECEIPEFDLGAGRTLGRSIHRADLFGPQKTAQMSRLIVAIQRAIGTAPGIPPESVSLAAADAGRAQSDIVEHVRGLMRNPTLVMDYDEFLSDLREPIQRALGDRERFPLTVAEGTKLNAEFAREWVRRIRDYDDILAPALIPLKLISMYGSQPHEQEFTQTLRVLGQESTQSAGTQVFRSAHEYPALVATFVAAVGSVAKQNYSMLRAATSDVRVATTSARQIPFVLTSGSQSVIGIDTWSALGTLLCVEDDGGSLTAEQIESMVSTRGGRRHTPISDHLFTVMAPIYRQHFASDADFADAFDRVEILLDAISEDARAQGEYYGPHGGYGRYTWRHRNSDIAPEVAMLEEVKAQGAGWTPLLHGLFGGDPDRASAALSRVGDLAAHIRSRLW